MQYNNTDSPLVVMSLAVTSIVVSQFGTGAYSNADVLMGIIAFLILICVIANRLSIFECMVFAAVCALVGFHFSETFQLYGSKGIDKLDADLNAMSNYGFTLSAKIATLVGITAFTASAIFRRRNFNASKSEIPEATPSL